MVLVHSNSPSTREVEPEGQEFKVTPPINK